MTNSFAPQAAPQQAPAQPQQQPMISDTAAQQPSPELQQAQQMHQQFATTQTAQNGGFPPAPPVPAQQQFIPAPPSAIQPGGGYDPSQGLPSQPWSPQQHAQNGQQMAAQAFAPPAHPQSGPAFPAAAPVGGGYDPSLFGAPSAGGGGTYPKARDLIGRLCLFHTKKRDAEGTAYEDPTKKITNYIANVAVLDGGALYASPDPKDIGAQPELVSAETPYVISDMIIGQVGLQNRLRNDFVRGRVVRHPKGKLEKHLLESFPGMPAWQALYTAMQQGVIQEAQLVSGTYFWTIVEDNSEQANQLVQAFAQHPSARDLML